MFRNSVHYILFIVQFHKPLKCTPQTRFLNAMKNPLTNKKALSQPVTAMILLVVPVMLTGSVVMYAYQIVGTQLQVDAVVVSNHHVWIYDDASSFAGFELDNIGGRDIVIDKIEVRGTEVLWATVHYYKTELIITDLLNCPSHDGQRWVNFEYTPGTAANFTQATGDIPLPSGYTIVVFIENPDNLRVGDTGASISITVYTDRAQYQVLCNAESAEDA